jgi:hypothetical protein
MRPIKVTIVHKWLCGYVTSWEISLLIALFSQRIVISRFDRITILIPILNVVDPVFSHHFGFPARYYVIVSKLCCNSSIYLAITKNWCFTISAKWWLIFDPGFISLRIANLWQKKW